MEPGNADYTIYKDYERLKLNRYIVPTEDISKKKDIYPSDKTLKQFGYKKIAPLLFYHKPYLYKGEHWRTWSSDYCINIPIEKSKPTKAIRVATFNVHNWTSRCHLAEDQTATLAKDLDRFLKKFTEMDADILCLQEMVPILEKPLEEDRDDPEFARKNMNFVYLVERMKKIGYRYSYIVNTQHSHVPIPHEYDEYFVLANGIFSKLPLKKAQGWKLPGNRSFIECSVKIGGKDVLLYNIHVDYYWPLRIKELMDDGFEKMGPFDHATNLQMDLFTFHILDTMKRLNIQDVVVCGDFNKPYDPSFRDLKRRKYHTAQQNFRLLLKFFKDPNPVKVFHPSRTTNFSQRNTTDFIFLSRYWSLPTGDYQIVKTDISDHYPVMIDIRQTSA